MAPRTHKKPTLPRNTLNLPPAVFDEDLKRYNAELDAYLAQRASAWEEVQAATKPHGINGRIVVTFKYGGASLHHTLRELYDGIAIAPGVWEIDMWPGGDEELKPLPLSFQRDRGYDELTPTEIAEVKAMLAQDLDQGEIMDNMRITYFALKQIVTELGRE